MGIRGPVLGTLGTLGVVVLVLVGLGNAVVAFDLTPRPLDELVLAAGAAPAPYAVVPDQSGDLDADLTAAIGISDTLVEAADAGYIRTWQDTHTGAVLRFFLDPTQGPLAKTEKQQQQALFEQTLRTNMLAEQVRDADYRLTLTKEFVENLKKLNKKKKKQRTS